MDDWVGRVLSKVRIEKLIGRGGMADVYVGRHTTLNHPMAVKILHSHMTVNPDLRRRFRDEAQAVAALRHPNIVQVIDFDVIDDRPYIVMELLEGMPLNEYLHDLHAMGHTLPFDTVTRLMTSLTAALDYAHNRQIVHRDVKPANIILRAGETAIKSQMPLAPDVEPVLTDFGIARIATSTSATASGTILGTPAYMSPEQVRGEPVDRRSDIYALGIILYEVLAGKLPFNPETDTPASILYKHVNEPPPVVPNVSPPIQRIVEKALAKDKDARYQQAGELAADLVVAIKSDAAPVAAAPAVTAVAAPPPPQAAAPKPGEPERKLRPSFALIAGIIFGAIVLVGGVVVGSQLVGGSEDEPANGQAGSTEVAEVVASEVVAPAATAVPDVVATASVPQSGPVSAVVIRDSNLEAQIPGVDTPSAGQTYHAWLLGEEGVLPLHLNRTGIVDLLGDDLIVSFDHPNGVNLLAEYEQFVISLEEEGSLLAQPTMIEYEAAFDSTAIRLVRLADEVKGRTPVLQNLSSWVPAQARHFFQHAGLVLSAVENENFPSAKTHLEHSINITEGKTGELFGDWDGDNSAVNPGDAVGLVPYLKLIQTAAEGGAKAEILRGGSGESGNAIADRADEIGRLLFDARETIRQMLLVDSLADISAFALDSDLASQREVRTLIDQLIADSQGVGLAFAFDIFASE
ncbi:MAG: serine/threonine-protein kinase [Anaerolineales bacterium]